MATRDRTPAFNSLKLEFNNRRPSKSFQSENSDDDSNNVPLVTFKGTSSGVSSVQPLKELPVIPQWMQRINDIDLNIKKISDLIDKLKGFHDKNLLPDMSMEDQSDSERSIEIITTEITRLFHRTHEIIKSLGKIPNLSPEDQKISKNIQNAKSATIQQLSLTFRQKQRVYLTALQKRSNLYRDIIKEDDDDDEGDVMDLDFSDELKQVVDHMEMEITQRDQDIRKIVASINDLSQLFQDISTLVVQQGSLLDRIDHNLESTLEDVIVGNKEVDIANQYHKEYRTRLCILMILVALVVAMVFLFILRIVF